MTSLGEDFPKQQEYARELLKQYYSIGPAGAYGALLIEHALLRADMAVMSGDVAEMIRSYNELKGLK